MNLIESTNPLNHLNSSENNIFSFWAKFECIQEESKIAEEICRNISATNENLNPFEDSDHDGIPDILDIDGNSSIPDPKTTDSDHDGIVDSKDINPNIKN